MGGIQTDGIVIGGRATICSKKRVMKWLKQSETISVSPNETEITISGYTISPLSRVQRAFERW